MSTTSPSSSDRCRAQSVTPEGEPDGWAPSLFYRAEEDEGQRRLLVSCPAPELGRVLRGLVALMGDPVAILYRQKIDRQDPKPQGHPGRDFVALDIPAARALEALEAADGLLTRDARSELWVRSRDGEQLVLDQDGVLYVYGLEAQVIAALAEMGVPAGDQQTIAQRDYVKHWFYADYDDQEDLLRQELNLTEIPVRP